MHNDSDFKPSATAAETLARAVMVWWKDARYETTGDRGDRNVFACEPDFVTMAKALVGDTAGMSYLAVCEKQAVELYELVQDFKAIADKGDIDVERRYQLLMGDRCRGRILRLFEALGTPFTLEFLDPRFFTYGECIHRAQSDIESHLRSLAGLLGDLPLTDD